MTESELIELLAEKEHMSWAHWIDYLFSKCSVVEDGAGYERYYITRSLVAKWKQQASASYAELSEREKQMDRDEVAHILPIIKEYCCGQKSIPPVSMEEH